MKSKRKLLFPLSYVIVLSVLFTSGCGLEEVTFDPELETAFCDPPLGPLCACTALIDLEGLERGTIVNQLSSGIGISGLEVRGSVGIYGDNPRFDTNSAMIFDTDNPSGNDPDLVVPDRDHGKILIISEDGDPEDPDDNKRPGGTLTFDFSDFGSGVVNVLRFTLIDTEEGGVIEAYDLDGELILEAEIPEISDGTDQVIELEAFGVQKLIITVPGSFGVDEMCVQAERDGVPS